MTETTVTTATPVTLKRAAAVQSAPQDTEQPAEDDALWQPDTTTD